jgi:protein O-mannosyl-transferase
MFKSQAVHGAVLVLMTVAVYAPVVHAGFIWDDTEHLTKNACIIGPLGFKDIWTSSEGFYYPLVLTTFWILHKFVDLNPLPYHVLNVLMHASSAVVLWRVLRHLGVRAAWVGAALWALHPVMVQSVAWVTELKNTQSGFFYLLSILCFLKADRARLKLSQYRSYLGLSLLFFVMASTSKSATVMLPAVLLLCLWWQKERLHAVDFLKLGPFFLISAVASAWTIWEQKFHSGATGAKWSQTSFERLAIAGKDIWFYLSKLAWPDRLSFFYPRWKIDGADLMSLLPLVAALGGLGFLFWKRNGQLRPVFFAFVYFVVSLFPVLGFFNVYFFRYSFVSDHFQYLASMGPLALLATGLSWVAGTDSGTRGNVRSFLQGSLMVSVLSLWAVLSWKQAHYYSNPKTLYQMSIERNRDSWIAYTNLGGIYLDEHQPDQAIIYYRKALEINPDLDEALYSLGNAFLAKNDFVDAVAPYTAALRVQPQNLKARSNLAICLVATGRVNDAIEQLGQALKTDPTYAEAHYNLGYLLVQLGRQEAAVPHLLEAVRLKPDYREAREQLRQLAVPIPQF